MSRSEGGTSGRLRISDFLTRMVAALCVCSGCAARWLLMQLARWVALRWRRALEVKLEGGERTTASRWFMDMNPKRTWLGTRLGNGSLTDQRQMR